MDAQPTHIAKLIDFEVPGRVVAWARPMQARNGGRFTKSENVAYSSLVKRQASEAMGQRAPITGPVTMSIVVTLPVAASWPKWKRAEALRGNIWPDKKPDLDNFFKQIADAIQEIVFLDDKQVVSIGCTKRYGLKPGVVVEVGVVSQVDRTGKMTVCPRAIEDRYRSDAAA